MAIALVRNTPPFGAELFAEVPLTVIQLDITSSERHTSKVDWTTHPVESGLDITDHAIEKQDEVTISGIISDTPLHTLPLRDRGRITYQDLVSLMKSKRLVTLVSGLKIYFNMAITSVNTRRDRNTGQAIHPSISLRQVRIVESISIPVPDDILRPDLSGAGSKINGGTLNPSILALTTFTQGVGSMLAVREDILSGTEDSFTSASVDGVLDFIDFESLQTESILSGLL